MIDAALVCVNLVRFMKTQKNTLSCVQCVPLTRSDIVLMVINAEEGIREYDKRIAGFAHEAGKVIIVVNKWDTIKKTIIPLLTGKQISVIQFQFFELCTNYLCIG